MPGFLEMSDGTVYPGLLFLTRDARLKIFDEVQKRQREIPWKSIKQIDGSILKEWAEKEWRFKENASDEKLFTGRTYPAREYSHKITLQNNQTIRGSLAGIVYVQADPTREPQRFCSTSGIRARPEPTSSRWCTSDRSSSATRLSKRQRAERPGEKPGRERKRGSFQESEGERDQGMSLV